VSGFALPGHGTFERPLVLGAARSGIAAARLLASRGTTRIVVNDRAPAETLPEAVRLLAEIPGVEALFGSHPAELADRADLVVVSPGIPLSLPLIARARERGIPVIGEVELAAPFVSARKIGITGSNGKSTTTALVAEIARAAGLSAEPAGNFGLPLSELAGSDLDLVAVELSSFQLETTFLFRPEAAIFLNLTPDHLDRYDGLADYGAAKARVFAAQQPGDFAVLNARDPFCAALAVPSRRLLFSTEGEVPAGAFVRDGNVVFRATPEEPAVGILPAGRIRIPGPHNLENALAAVAASLALGLPAEAAARALEGFSGLPHRCEPAGTIRGIRFVNDSKGTNVDAALKSFAAFEAEAKIWLVLGGRDKHGDFSPLREALEASPRDHVVLTVGEAAPVVREAIGTGVDVIDCGTIEMAVDVALERGRSGDVVLLSPACASFDQFKNFEHRGEEFRRIVRERMNRPDSGGGS
jgi:UDP-N-acetylmuramoylalanine--D-glutamate ligase